MGIYSSGKKYKSAAEAALAEAQGIEDAQRRIEFGRNLLANIRQERIARAQLELGNTSADYSSSSAAGAVANIDSSLAGEMRYSYETSHRAQKITDLNETAQKSFKKYAKQQKTRATAFSVTGAVVGAAAGAFAAPFMGASIIEGAAVGSQLGQGIGQIASKTGQEQTGINNIVDSLGTTAKLSSDNSELTSLIKSGTIYQTESIDPTTNKAIANSKQFFTYSPRAGKAVPLVGGIFS